MSSETLGGFLSGGEGRDAIHVAIAPVISAGCLAPGQEVGFVEDGNTELVGPSKTPIGIVDPFLKCKTVPAGARFWVCLFPNTITSLRHEWVHPAFGEAPPTTVKATSESEQWIRGYAEQLDMGYDEVMRAAERYLTCGDYYCFHGVDTPTEAWVGAKTFWHHYEIVTGKHVNESDKASFFTCSC